MAETTNGGAAERPPLDDVMLAMDVVDTLRRRKRLVSRELDEIGREQDLKQRLKRIYAQQGIDVPDHVIEQGVAALKEDRFTYKPKGGGLARRLAHIYVSRGRWGKWLGGGLAAAVLGFTANYFAFVAPDKALPETLSELHAEVVQLSQGDKAKAEAQRLLDAGRAALRTDDPDAARAAIDSLEQLQAGLEQTYTVQIVNRPGERSGVWRIPDINTKARNYYVIVEALDASGRRLKVPIRNEESGKTEMVSTWGLRVNESTFDAVKRDKQDDGIIENDRFGVKKRGFLEPSYEMPTSGGAITRW
jgi:hypothetical protein